MPRDGLSGHTLVTLDFECWKCKIVEERVIRNDKREVQPCSKCGKTMQVQFPLGNQLKYECDFKPFLDYITSPQEKMINTKSEWRARKKQSKFTQEVYKGGGWCPSDLTGGIIKGK